MYPDSFPVTSNCQDTEVRALLSKDLFAALRPAAAVDANAYLAKQRAAVATAFAYHRKREFVQTAPTGAVAEAVGYVPRHGEPPDAAGPGHVVYLTPLSFVNDVFLNSVGEGFCDPSATSVSNLVERPPAGTLVFSYDSRADPGQKRFWTEMKKMWSLVEPADVVAFMMDHPTPKGRPGRCHVVLYVGDALKDGHAEMLHVTGGGGDAATALGRTNGALKKSLFDGLLHRRNANFLKDATKVVLLRPLAKKGK